MAREDIYSWGNLAWADYRGPSMPALDDRDIMHLLFVAPTWRAIDIGAVLKATGGRFVACSHDDERSLRLWCADPSDVEGLVKSIAPPDWAMPDFAAFWSGASAFWLRAGEVHVEERTADIDSVRHRRGWRRPAAD